MVAVLGFEPSQYPDLGIMRFIRPPMQPYISRPRNLAGSMGFEPTSAPLTAERSTVKLTASNSGGSGRNRTRPALFRLSYGPETLVPLTSIEPVLTCLKDRALDIDR